MKRPIKYMVEIFVRARARTCAQGLRQKNMMVGPIKFYPYFMGHFNAPLKYG